MFYVFRTLPPISVPSAKTTCLTMRTFSKRKPNKEFIELEFFFQLLKLVKKENLKTATELVKEYVKNPEDF